MKIKSLFIAALAMTALASCNKKDLVEAPATSQNVVTLEISAESLTRTFEGVVGDGDKSKVNTLDLYFTTPTAISKVLNLDAAKVKLLTKEDGKYVVAVEGVDASVNEVHVVANSTIASSDKPSAGAPEANIEAKLLGDVLAQQGDGVDNVTLFGKANVGQPATGQKIVVVGVQIKPALARFEVTGTPELCLGMSDFKVEGVVLANYNATFGDATTNVKAVAYQSDFTDSKYILQDGAPADEAALIAKTKGYGYNIFAAKMPIVLVKISAKFTDPNVENAEVQNLNGYLTFKTFGTMAPTAVSDKANDLTEIKQIEEGKIYRIDLSMVDYNKNDKSEDPKDPKGPWGPGPYNPNSPDPIPDVITPGNFKPALSDVKDITVKVDVLGWKLVNVIAKP